MNKQIKIIIFSIFYAGAILAYLFGVAAATCAIAVLITAFLYFKQKSISFKYSIFLIFIFLLGLINTSFHFKYDDDLVSLSDKNLTVEAKVMSIPTNNHINKKNSMLM